MKTWQWPLKLTSQRESQFGLIVAITGKSHLHLVYKCQSLITAETTVKLKLNKGFLVKNHSCCFVYHPGMFQS